MSAQRGAWYQPVTLTVPAPASWFLGSPGGGRPARAGAPAFVTHEISARRRDRLGRGDVRVPDSGSELSARGRGGTRGH